MNCPLSPGSPGYCYLVTTVCVGGWEDPSGGSSGGGGGSPDPCGGSITLNKSQTASIPCGSGWYGIGTPDPSTSFTINGVTYTTSNYPGINNGLPWKWWENASILAPFGGLTYGTWAINYLSLNPQLPFSAFQNLFMTSSEGSEEGDPDVSFWDDPNNTFPPQPLPSWDAFEAAFPKRSNYTPSQVYQLIGGDVQSRYGMAENSCAARISRALNYSGIIIPHISGKTFMGADGKYYFVRVSSLNKWMRKTFGCKNPNTAIGEYLNISSLHNSCLEVDNLISSLLNPQNEIKGIFTCIYPNQSVGASGHADLLKNSNPWCNGGCGFEYLFDFIDIWVLK